MGMERRLFKRTTIEVPGTLSWTGKGRFGGKKVKTAPIETVDLSLDGAKVAIRQDADLGVGSFCQLQMDNTSSDALVRDVVAGANGRKLLCVQLHQPPGDFLRTIDRWLTADAGGHRQLEDEWLSNPYE